MSRKKIPQTLPELYAAKGEAEEERRKAKQREKTLENRMSKLTRMKEVLEKLATESEARENLTE